MQKAKISFLSQVKTFLTDVFEGIKLNTKLVFSSKFTFAFIFIVFVSYLVILLGMDKVKEEKSGYLIGIANEDESDFSLAYVEKLKTLEGIKLEFGNKDELLLKLKNGDLLCVTVIPKGFEKKVKNGNFYELIGIYEIKDRQIPMVCDLLAGGFVDLVSAYKSYSYVDYKIENYTFEKYLFEADKLEEANPDRFDFAFDFKYVNENSDVQQPKNEVIYLEVVVVSLLTALGFITMYFVSFILKSLSKYRLRKLSMSYAREKKLLSGSYASAFLLSFLFGALFTAFFAFLNKENMENGFAGRVLSLILLVMCITFIKSLMYLIVAFVSGNMLYYQSISTFLTITLSIMTFLGIASDFVNLPQVLSMLPDVKFVEEFARIYAG
ncbi:MAG: ABC transporter permease [Lachnospiraceae bacterium]|nr:ABC transporter permease [Lachnospiraceae bacterium]